MSSRCRAWYYSQVDEEISRAVQHLQPRDLAAYHILCAVISETARTESYVLVDGASIRVQMQESFDPTS